MKSARRIEQDDVIGLKVGGLDRPLGDVDRLLAGHNRKRIDACLATKDCQLFLGGRAGNVERCHKDALAFAL